MSMMFKYPIALFFSVFVLMLIPQSFYAQCAIGESSVSLVVTTDDYGYEGYWELTAEPNPCGTQTIAFGGNVNVGCISGSQNQDPSGYGNNLVINEGPWCLTNNAYYTIHYRDDWGDGGFHFRILINGLIAHEFYNAGSGVDFTFQVLDPPLYDLACYTHVNSTQVQGRYVQQQGNPLEVILYNFGAQTVTSAEISYSVNGDTPVIGTLNGLSIVPYTSIVVQHPVLWTPSSDGSYTIEFSVNSINGNPDEVPLNNSESAVYLVGPGRPYLLDDYISGLIVPMNIATSANSLSSPIDLDFHPTLTKKQLWIINKGTESSGGSTVTIDNTGEANQISEFLQDGNAWHFMSLPSGIAFSDNGNFATSPGVFDANHTGTAVAFTGPTLWSSDPAIYAQPSGGNGSHLDMLHESPYSQGIAWEKDNVFWLFDGYNNDIVRYDFVNDHNPGNSDHSDGIVHRYSDVAVLKDLNGTISHLELDEAKDWLYVVDNGNQRIFRMNIHTGTPSATPPSYGPHEGMAEYLTMTGYTWENVVSTGLLDPAGIAIQGNRMLVSDHQSNEIILYDISSMPATELRRINTSALGIMGIAIGPEGKIYYVDNAGNKVVRLDPEQIPLNTSEITSKAYSLFPNPSQGQLGIASEIEQIKLHISVFNSIGQALISYQTESGKMTNLNIPAGVYFIVIKDENGKFLAKKPWIISK